MDDKKFGEILEKVSVSNVLIKSSDMMSILSGLIDDNEGNAESIKKIVESAEKEKLTTEQIVKRVIMLTCNCVVINIWNNFENIIEKAYEINKKKIKSES